MKQPVKLVLIFAALGMLFSCAQQESKPDPLRLVTTHSKRIKGDVLKVEDGLHLQEYPKADNIFVKQLKQLGVLESYGEPEGCMNTLHYYGYFPFDTSYTAAIFGWSLCTCCGDDQLIMALINKSGHIVSAKKVAELQNASECFIQVTTFIKGNQLTMAWKEECGILEGADSGNISIDTTTTVYTIDNTARIKQNKHDSAYFVRSESLR